VSIATAILKPSVRNVFLAEVTAGFLASGWIDQGGGYTNTYKVACAHNVTAVYENGTALTNRASVSLVNSNAGSWILTGGYLSVRSSSSAPFAFTYVGQVNYYFASHYRVNGSTPYDPRLKSIPAVSLRIEEKFSGVGQVGGGDLVLINSDGYFDDLDSLKWNWGRAVIKYGVDTFGGGAWQEMAVSDFQTVGTWAIDDTTQDDADFKLKLKEQKDRGRKKIPVETFNRDDYPTLPNDTLGKVIPRAYGVIKGSKPLLTDSGTKTFKLAGHAVFSIDRVRVKINDVWTSSDFATIDTATATFTLGSDWETGREVSVDFTGRVNTDGTAMLNAADVVSDLLTYAGETSQNSADFAAARAILKVGMLDTVTEKSTRSVALYLDTAREVISVLSDINDAVGSFIYVNAGGEWSYNVFDPLPGDSLQTFTEADTLDLTIETDNSDNYSIANVTWAKRDAEGYGAIYSLERAANQYAANLSEANAKSMTAPLSKEEDAAYYAGRFLLSQGTPFKRYRFTVPHQGFLLLPGDQIRLTDTRRGLDEVLEVVSINANLTAAKMQIVATRLREWGRNAGFWTEANPLFPSSLGGLSAAVWDDSWSAAQKEWARQNIGYWTDDNGMASSTDSDSAGFSTWI
jgi:hypothetical protein